MNGLEKNLKNINIKYLGFDFSVSAETDLLLRIIANVSKRNVLIVDSTKDADLIIVHPYVIRGSLYKIKWVLNFLFNRIAPNLFGKKDALRWFIGTGTKKVLFVSHENLDRPYWWNMIGKFLIESNVARLTYWPREIDSCGERFPYWYNYVDWPDYKRPNFYRRFGRLYRIDELMAPLPFQTDRQNRCVSISSHLEYPRASLLQSTRRMVEVDSYGASGMNFDGSKIDLMQKYRYAFCPENSTGYGYDTEKLPEAWVAGCIPLGVSTNPFSDFNPNVIHNGGKTQDIHFSEPLLLKEPRLDAIEEYVRANI